MNTSSSTIGRLTNKQGSNVMFEYTDLPIINEVVSTRISEVPSDQTNTYRRYYEEKEKNQIEQDQVALVKARNRSDLILDPNQFNQNVLGAGESRRPLGTFGNQKNALDKNNAKSPLKRFKKSRKRVYLDSRNRDKVLYPDASSMRLFLGNTFQNVLSIKMNNIIFPNVDQAVNEQNRKISWINLEDMDLDPPFPIYEFLIKPGTYRLQTIGPELQKNLNNIPRHNGIPTSNGDPPSHTFDVQTSFDTDYVSFTSLIAIPTQENPVRVLANSRRVYFTLEGHGFKDNDIIHVAGVRALGGVLASEFNRTFSIRVETVDVFSSEINVLPNINQIGGGNVVTFGREAPFQLLFGSEKGNLSSSLGFREENSSEQIDQVDPLTTIIREVVDVIPNGQLTTIVAPMHGLRVGDYIKLNNVFVFPSIQENKERRGAYPIVDVLSPDAFQIQHQTQSISDITNAFIGTRLLHMHFPDHGFNRITDIEQVGPNLVQVTTLFDHGLQEDSPLLLSGTNSVPPIDGYYAPSQIGLFQDAPDVFTISNVAPKPNLTLTSTGFRGILSSDYTFYLYDVTPFGGFTTDQLNNTPFQIREIIDADNFTFSCPVGFSNVAESGGGGRVRINSKLHGWAGTHTNNTASGELIKPVTLSGEDYAFICLPNLPSANEVSYSGNVKNIFTQIYITDYPGHRIFNQFDPEPLTFRRPIPSLGELMIEVRNPFNRLLNFNQLDYSFGLILETLDEIDEDMEDQGRATLDGSFDQVLQLH